MATLLLYTSHRKKTKGIARLEFSSKAIPFGVFNGEQFFMQFRLWRKINQGSSLF